MSDNILMISAVTTALGFLSGLGIGGGSLLLLWLTQVVGMEQTTARLINLLFFLPSAAAASCFRWKQGDLCLKRILPAILGGCIGALIGSSCTKLLPISTLRKAFGILLIATGIRELLYKRK